MKRVQVHYTDRDGKTGVMNYLTAENTELSGASGAELSKRVKKLQDYALSMAAKWGTVYPDTRFTVVTTDK